MTVPMIKSIGDVPYPIDTHSDVLSPLLTAGAALGITGEATDSAAWLQRVSTSDGPTTVKSIHGNTIVQDGALVPVQMEGIETEDAGGNPIQTRTIPAGTLRGAGSVYDELTETERITRIGEVDLGTLDWNSISTPSSSIFRSTISGVTPAVKFPPASQVLADAMLAEYVQKTYDAISSSDDMCFAISPSSASRLVIVDKRYTDAAAFKTAMSGVMLYYALATPTTTPIDPPLNMSYRTEQGGTERVMVPTGELSAPPTLVTAQGYTAKSLRDAALATIAPVENGTASTNYAVDAYLVHGGQLCRVTTAIATGEAITIGTNVMATTVMAEVIALIAQ